MSRSFTFIGLVVAAPVALFVSTPSPAASQCSSGDGYNYAGLQSASRANGVAATISIVSPPRIMGGHVAAWVGVGGEGLGPNGADEWLQVGLSTFPGSQSALYYELKLPGRAAKYVKIRNIVPRERHRVAVLELVSRPGWWQVLVDGRRVAAPVRLPGSHGAWEPLAVAENWDGGVGACNSYAYSFEGIALAITPEGGWQPLTESYVLQDPGYRVVRPGRASFIAKSVWP